MSLSIKKLSLDSNRTIKDIKRSSCLLVWLLSSNKDLVFSGGDVPLGIIEHHFQFCHDKGHLIDNEGSFYNIIIATLGTTFYS